MHNELELKVAVLGAGAIANEHFDAIQATDGLCACAVADVQWDRASEMAKQHGVNAYLDYREMIRIEQPDIAVIALPHFLHKESALFAAEHGCHLLLG
ncbi:putative dehydrogenase [Paenibacillus endophyticus]|uniref:Putative dehydrogenase n=1 Tax=Paenibacillus endophyticus TaxID=1294268 RepID=A0A7W5GAD6_9BACL|nr:Gfo/Idh/MocA family oxidoreductase [Paenibacillus endophyticus]MBB3151842.1 putative dehydrogenase [Paenibacillus endophyticus]